MDPVIAEHIISPWVPGVFSLFSFIVAILVLMAVMLLLTRWLGEKRFNPDKQRPYESGIIPTGTARLRYPVPFFLVAIFFLLFDVEGAFIFSWAVACKSLGWKGWLQMAFFIFILLLGLVYIWRKGGLEWHGKTRIR
ncbi:MAG TPA: NADH-quinone oxidoreductase subunit A [Desulfosalsimonadaceae bacterium]|nr:NADH-quinone oxidoreductase subunit A [Desulfosalsimonadaceae bacterium]